MGLITSIPVRAQAICEEVRHVPGLIRPLWTPVSGPAPLWRVIVFGQPPHAYERTYLIVGHTEDVVAYEGIRRFVAEAEASPGKLVGV